MSQYCPSVQKSNVQRAFAMIETVPGELEKPTASGFVAPGWTWLYFSSAHLYGFPRTLQYA